MSYAPVPRLAEPDNTAHAVIAWVLTVLSLFFMLPWAIAATRHTRNAPLIGVLTLLLGWTGLGWIGMLVWACLDQHKNYVPPVTYGALTGAPPYPYQPPDLSTRSGTAGLRRR